LIAKKFLTGSKSPQDVKTAREGGDEHTILRLLLVSTDDSADLGHRHFSLLLIGFAW
jgi:hypothetical protein